MRERELSFYHAPHRHTVGRDTTEDINTCGTIRYVGLWFRGCFDETACGIVELYAAALGHSLDSDMVISGIGINVEGLGRFKVVDAYAGKPLYDNVVDEQANTAGLGKMKEVEAHGIAFSYGEKQLARLPCSRFNRIFERLGTHRKRV